MIHNEILFFISKGEFIMSEQKDSKNTLYINEYTTCVIDAFEDFLYKRGIELPTSEQEKKESGDLDNNAAIIYGADFDELMNAVTTPIVKLAQSLRPDIEVNTIEYGYNDKIASPDTISIDTPAGIVSAYIDTETENGNPQIGIMCKSDPKLSPRNLCFMEVETDKSSKNYGKIFSDIPSANEINNSKQFPKENEPDEPEI